MNWTPKNIHDSILPIMILNCLAGLSMFEYPLGKPRPVFTFIYVLSINVFYWFVTLSNKIVLEVDDITKIGTNIFGIVVHGNIVMAVSSVAISWYYYKTHKINIERLELLDKALESMGLLNNHRKIFITTMLKVATWIIIIGILLAVDSLALKTRYDWFTSMQALYIFHCPLHFNSIVDFSFISIVNVIGMRFENINLLLKRPLEKRPKPKTVRELYPKYSRVSALVLSTEYSDSLLEKELKKRLLILVRYLHMELSKISSDVNKVYQKQIMMAMGAHFIIITGLLYNLFAAIFFSNRSFKAKIKPIMSTSVWCIVYTYKLLNITSSCAKVSLEARRTRDILYELKTLNEDEEIKEESEQFSLQLTHRPLAFTACGFSTLDYTLVQRFIGSVTTYLVILIQFSPEISD